ncbi:hypothetical protein DM415_27675, partial [Escherichia coli]|nr:hypothetical protein [Escherichia coli]
MLVGHHYNHLIRSAFFLIHGGYENFVTLPLKLIFDACNEVVVAYFFFASQSPRLINHFQQHLAVNCCSRKRRLICNIVNHVFCPFQIKEIPANARIVIHCRYSPLSR